LSITLCSIIALTSCRQPVDNGDGGKGAQIVAPEMPSATPGDSMLTIVWTKVATATGYQIWYTANTPDITAVEKFTGVISEAGRQISAEIKGLANGTVYYVWTKAVFPGGISGFSPVSEGFAPLPKPLEPSISSVKGGDQSLLVEWDTVYDATGYEAYYCDEPTPQAATKWNGAASIDEGKGSVFITGLTNLNTYYVWVKATNSAGSSPFSDSSYGRPVGPTGAPPVPVISEVKPGNRKLTVSWSSVTGTPDTGATFYEVYYNTVNSTAGSTKLDDDIVQKKGTVTAVITELANNTEYYVWVKSANSSFTSGFSAGASGTPQPKAPIDYNLNAKVIGTAELRFINEEDGNKDRLSRKKETALGDLLCESFAWYARDIVDISDLDFVYLNGGIITGGISKGDITIANVKTILPYDDCLTVITLKGTYVKELFEYAATVRHDGSGGSGTGAWGMVSKEIRYTIDYGSPEGLFGTLKNLTFNGTAIDVNKDYKIATADFLVEGNDGYIVFKEHATIIASSGIPAWCVLVDYIYDQDAPLIPVTDGRVQLIGGVVK
jgi:hypothetical protein